MPNWKKIALSGSNPEFSSLTVDGAIEASKFSGSFSGSIQGDGSELTGLSLPQVATVSDTFTSATSKTVTHNFSTKNVIVQVYDNDDNIIIPKTVTTTDTNTVDITLDTSTTGRVVVAKGGHIVSGSVNFDNLSNKPTLVSSSAQIAADISGSLSAAAIVSLGAGILSGSSSDGAISSSAQIVALGANIVSSSAQIADNISGSGNIRFEALNTKTGSLETTNTTQNARLNSIEVKSGSIDTAITALGTESGSVKTRLNTIEAATGSYALKTQISGSFTAVSASFATTIGSLTSDYTELTNIPANIVSSSAQIGTDISGSLSAAAIVALGAGILSGSSADGAISSSAQIVNLGAGILSGSQTLFSQSFSSATAVTASHGFGTKDVAVYVYDSNDNLFFPNNIKTATTSAVHLDFNSSRTGRVVVSKGGHVVDVQATATTASYVHGLNVHSTVGSATSASFATSTPTASFASTGPFLSNTGGTVDGDVVITGNITANEYILSSSVSIVTSSFSSGSTIFGDTLNDTHLFTGSLNVTGSANLVASQSVNTRDDSSLSMWAGSQAQYDALGSYNSNTIYFVT